jgi:CheY-like chemotaxis protein
MNQLKMGVCHYPTTTLLVDDNQSFLSQMSLNLSTQNIACLSYIDPLQALQYLDKIYQPDPFTNRCIKTKTDRRLDSLVSYFDFRNIHHEIYNPKRFAQISVISADYAMPTMDGLNFCRHITENFSFKLLLTGEASLGLAVDAFNEGIIDKFLPKGSLELPVLLVQGINKLKSKYFIKLSEFALSKASNHLFTQVPPCLNDANFLTFFNDLIVDNNIVEYYLLDEHGSFLLLDIHASPSWLIVKSDADMNNLYQFAHDQDAPQNIINIFETRSKVPYFHTDKDLKTPFEQCEKYLHPATELQGQQKYFYSYVTEPNAYELQHDKILPYFNYMQNN